MTKLERISNLSALILCSKPPKVSISILYIFLLFTAIYLQFTKTFNIYFLYYF